MDNTKEMLSNLEEFKGYLEIYFKRQKEVVSKVLTEKGINNTTTYTGRSLPNVFFRLVGKDISALFGFTGNIPSEVIQGVSSLHDYTAYEFLECLYTCNAMSHDTVHIDADVRTKLATWDNLLLVQGGDLIATNKEDRTTNFVNVDWLDLVIEGKVAEYLTQYEKELRISLETFAPMFLEELANEPTWEELTNKAEETEIAQLKQLAERYPQVVKSLAFEA